MSTTDTSSTSEKTIVTQPLSIGDSGYSLGYFVLSWRKMADTVDQINEALEEAIKAYERRHTWRKGPKKLEELDPRPTVELFAMTGRCDLLVVVKQPTFRFISYFQNELALFPAKKTTWIHTVPYQLLSGERSIRPLRWDEGQLFQLYLKTRRDPYREFADGSVAAGTRIAEKLERFLDTSDLRDDFDLRIYTTLGWPDCLLSGACYGGVDKQLHLLHKIEQIFMTIGEERRKESLFHKRLTLTGLHLDRENGGRPSVLSAKPGAALPRYTPFVLMRTKAGSMNDGKKVLAAYCNSLSPEPIGERCERSNPILSKIRGIDGKWDLMASFVHPMTYSSAGGTSLLSDPTATVSLKEIAASLYTLVAPKDEPLPPTCGPLVRCLGALESNGSFPVERIETHLIVSEMEKEEGDSEVDWDPEGPVFEFGERDVTDEFGSKTRLEKRIRIVWELLTRRPEELEGNNRDGQDKALGFNQNQAKITSPLRNEIAAILSLFATISRESDNRKVSDHAIHGALDALQEILGHLAIVKDELLLLFPQSREIGELYSSRINYLRTWCTVSGSAVRQREAGSFANLFNRPLSVPALRGSLQKMLHTADGLMREFVGFLPGELTEDPAEPHLNNTLGKNGLRIRRPPRLASVFAPTVRICSHRYLDLVEIPSRYAVSLQLVYPQLLHEVGQSLFFRIFNPFVSVLEHELSSSMRRIGVLDSPVDEIRFLGDCFSDLIVYTYAFSRDFVFFRDYLSTTFYYARQDLVERKTIQEMEVFGQLVERLLVVYAFETCLRNGKLEEFYGTLRKLRHDASEVERIALPAWTRYVAKEYHLDEQDLERVKFDLSSPRFSVIDSSLHRCASRVLRTYHRNLMFKSGSDVVEGPGSKSIDTIESILHEGAIHEAGEGLLVGELFLAYYKKVLYSPSSQDTPKFAELSALGFTALQTFRGSNAFNRGRRIRLDRLGSNVGD